MCSSLPYACQWSSENWSCAYDSIFTAFFSMYCQLDINMRQNWGSKNVCAMLLRSLFDNLIEESEASIITSASMNASCNELRNYLFTCDAQ